MKTKSYVFMALWAVAVVFGILILLQSVRTGGIYSIWADRDLFRSFYFFSDPQYFGAEMTAGGRIPGGSYYFLLGLLQKLNLSPLQILWTLNLAYLASAFALAFALYRNFGPSAGAATSIFLVASPLAGQHLTQVWNPAVGMILGNLFFALLIPILNTGRAQLLPLAALLAGVAGQIHLTYLLLIPFGIITLLIARVPVKRHQMLLALAAIIALYLPTIYHEATHHFFQTREWLTKGLPTYLRIGPHKHYTVITQFKAIMDTAAITRDWRTWGCLGPTLLFVISLFWLSRGARKQEPTLSALMVAFLLGSLALLPFSTQFQARYGLFLWPIGAAIAGISLSRWWAIKRVWIQPALILLLAAWVAHANNWKRGTYALNADTLQTVVNTLRNEFSWSRSDVSTRLTLLYENPGDGERWLLPPEGMRSIDFLNRKPSTVAHPPSTECALVLLRGRKEPLPENEILEAAAKVPGPLNVKTIVRRNEAIYAFYAPREGNCMRNVANPYLPDATPVMPGKIGFDLHLYQFDQPRPLRVRLEIHLDGKEAWATVYSPQLRGYDGIQAFFLSSANLRFRNLATDQFIQLPLSNEPIGKEFFFAPWNSAKVPLTRGDYLVSFAKESNGYTRLGFLKSTDFPDPIYRIP